ncbi:MAG: hypothetical protein KDB23_07205 [Planctomycetales bacterium]|nr:hypothetical protein [Planctomycetales bacterium]
MVQGKIASNRRRGCREIGSRREALRWALSLVACGLSFSLGCTAWKETASEGFKLPTTRMSPDSIGIELTFVRVPLEQSDLNATLWPQIDEQAIEPEARHHLHANGFRCGIVGLQMPTELRELLDNQEVATRLDQAVTTKLDVLAQNQRSQYRSGQRFEIISSDVRDELVVLHRALDGKLCGQPFSQAQCVLAAKPFPQGDGSVRVELTPEVHHGQPQATWVGGQGTFQKLTGRQREVYQDLLMGLNFQPGQTIVLSCTPDRKGLGHNFFVEDGRGDPQQKLLLIRLAQVQRDELFETAQE